VTTDLTPIDDPYDRRRARSATGLLHDLNVAGVLEAADVHVATRLGRLGGEADETVLAAAALAVRAVRQGSVCLDLGTVHELGPGLAWPDVEAWQESVSASPLVRDSKVLRQQGGLLYLDRYWTEEGRVRDDVVARRNAPPPDVDAARLGRALDLHFPGDRYSEQRVAAEIACRHWTSVITGGPGTGKTTTIARLLGALLTATDRPLRVALAAPTGKAAARMAQAVAQAAGEEDFPASRRAEVAGLRATTMHRLLGSRPDSRTRFRSHRGNRLPHDVVVIDETSMVSLSLMARLLEAVRPDARLVLVGDADQLASVDAGAVLKDLVDGLGGADGVHGVDPSIARLRTSHRFGGGIGELASAIRDGDPDAAVDVLTSGTEDVALVGLGAVQGLVLPPALALAVEAEAGRRPGALAALDAHRLLCGHRTGPFGVRTWNRQVERWLLERSGADWLPRWYAGQSFLVTANDYGLGLFNGDTGVVCRSGTGASDLVALVSDGEHPEGREYALTRLADVATAHAMTVHRSQGSQFDAVTIILPEPESPLLTRELLYTAVTRARRSVRLVGSEESVRIAIGRRAQRASGLSQRLQRG